MPPLVPHAAPIVVMATDDLHRPVVTDTPGKAGDVVAARAAATGTTTAGECVAAAPAGSAMGNGSGNANLPDGHMDRRGMQHPTEPPCAAVHVRYPRLAHCSQLIPILSLPLFHILAELTRSCVHDIECLRVGNATVTNTFTPL